MNDAVAVAPTPPRFQFFIGDVVAAIVSLAFPVAFATHLDGEWITDAERNSLWALILVTLAVGFLIAVAFRRAWISRSPLFVPPFLMCAWCWLLPFYAWDIPVGVLYGMLAYPVLFLGLATTVYCRKTQADNPFVAGATVLGFALLIATLVGAEVATMHMAKREIKAAATCKGIAEAQEIFHRSDRDNDGLKEYSPNLRGLYETKPGAADLNLISAALVRADITGPSPQPYRGYYYRILLGQGDMAPGGAKTWMDDKGNLTLAHGAVAYPSEYGKTGIHSFVISSTGTIYQNDYGPGVPKIAKDTVFNPDTNWGCCGE